MNAIQDFKCPICFDGNTDENGELVQKFTLSCNHEFHTKCICESLRYDTRCPICRDSGASLEQKQQQSQAEQDEEFMASIPWKQRLSIRQKFINAGIKHCRNQLKDPKNEEYKHIKAFIRKYDNTKARLKKIKDEKNLITPEYRKIRKEYTDNHIVKQYMKFRPWKLNHTIRAKENMLFRMFATDLSYQMLYGCDVRNVKTLVKNQYESVVKPQLLTLPTR